ncbi:hypothetical protein V8G56_13450 [Gaetbulibacter aquiaggeris]|uniref:Outer membrane protein beta-barrel domain-containing protein n=1 Tax=Gaetbulibacter aquiaggeris TaxID=1735373 RepID=A0ABW7MVD6_9FLAO
MKNLILYSTIILIAFSAYGQRFSIGSNLGAPVSDAHDFYSFIIGIDANYWFVSDKFSAGIATGFNFFLSNELKGNNSGFYLENASFVPIAFASRFDLSDKFILGADVGYAIGVGNDGGFYYRPIFGYNISDSVQLTLSYRGISTDGLSVDAVTVGVNYSFSNRKD